ncbi:MAG: sigma 54-interacting transcriptional regulator [Lentisphaerae bacterium]|nr:sigma 54-interacting transcriptional regulator [Lentisphaerota bacterium]
MYKDDNADPIDSPTLVLSQKGSKGSILVQKSKLLVVNGIHQGREFVVDKDVFSIGSGGRNDLVLDDTTVSRRHCEIQLIPEGYVVRDLGSTNGTIVQGVRVTEAFLTQSTEFQLGQTRFVFCPLRDTVEYTLSESLAFGALLGQSVAMRRVFHLAETYAPTDAVILIEGETGTGKEVLAQEIHRHSKRKGGPFVVIDCAALARDIVQSELFGHTKGAFTGAVADRVGAFEHAAGGTVFLDEVADLAPDLQPKLLRVLESREVRRVGSNTVRPVDVRVVCATNRRLENEVNAGNFREDLFFRLSVVHIGLPPLRKRKEDIPVLLDKFVGSFKEGEEAFEIADPDGTMDLLYRHDWPGNVRELRNLVEIACYSGKGTLDLASFLCIGGMTKRQADAPGPFVADRPFKEAKGELIRQFEEGYVQDILKRHGGNISRAARAAGIERAYLQRLVRKLDITAGSHRA